MSGESNYSFTAKTPAGNLLTFRGDSIEEFTAHLLTGADPSLPGLLESVEANLGNRPGAPVAPPAAPVTAPAPAQPAPPSSGWGASAAPVDSGAPTCPHGVRVYKEGGGGNTGKRPWKAYMCPAPKGTPGACQPQWV